MQVHRTSSSRKARRKNEGIREGKGPFINYPFTGYEQSGLNSGQAGQSWRSHVAWWLLEQLKNATTFIIGLGCALFYFHNSLALFENITKFPHLTNLEKEFVLPAHTAFRYGFFKKIAQAESYMDGLKLVTRDQDELAGTANSFQRYSLTPEAILGGGFHVIKTLNSWLNWSWSGPDCWKVKWTSSRNIYNGENDESSSSSSSLSCSGLGDPLTFYFKSILTLESFVVILIFYLGLRFGKCVLGGIVASGLFIFLHPQRFNYEWFFALHEKIGWVLVFSQLYCVSRVVFCSMYPSWRSIVKIGIVSALLILVWNTEAQWFLTSQILILAVLHIFDFFTRRVVALVIFGQVTGWQYASLVSLDTSFQHWSFFLYSVTAAILVIFILGPTLDWILGKKIDKWTFMRRTILLVTLQTVLISVRCDLGQMFSFQEDSRFPLSISMMEEDIEPVWKRNIDHVWSQPKGHDIPSHLCWEEQQKEEEMEEEENFLNKISLSGLIPDPPHSSEEEEMEEDKSHIETAADFMPKRIKNLLSFQLTGFLRGCLHSRSRISLGTFLSKYFFLLFAVLYSLFVSLLLPWVTSKSRGQKDGTMEDTYATSNFIKRTEDGNSWKMSKGIFHLLHLLFSGGGGKDCSSHGLDFSGHQSEGEKNRWNSLLTYHILQMTVFVLFSLALDKKAWEIFFISHTCLLIALLCDFQMTRQTLAKCRFTYASHVHWSTIVVILGILVASSQLRSTQMFQKSRGRFEIGSAKIGSLMEVHQWIKLNTEKDSAKFTGSDNLMVTLSLTTQRSTVNHHLTVHSWGSGEDDDDHFEFDGRHLGTKSRSQLGNPVTSPGDGGSGRRRKIEEGAESMNEDEMGGSVGLNSKPTSSGTRKSSTQSSWTIRSQLQTPGMRMTSRLTPTETQRLTKIYTLFNPWASFGEFYTNLVKLNVSHLMLSNEDCPPTQLTPLTHLPASATPRQIVTKIPHPTPHDSHHPTTRMSSVDSTSSSDEELPQGSPSPSISGTWQWTWDSTNPKSQEGQQQMSGFIHFSKNCDVVQFWDFVEKRRKKAEEEEKEVTEGGGRVSGMKGEGRQNFKSHQNSLRKDDFDSNVKGSYQAKSSSSPPPLRPIPHKINEHGKRDRKSNEAQRRSDSSLEEEEEQESTLYCRLLKERNILPFKRVFQNHFFTILAV